MDIAVSMSIPYLWGDKKFKKNEWGPINYLVGSNGTGKSTFIEQLQLSLPSDGSVRYLTSDRLVDWTKRKHSTYTDSQLERGLDTQLLQKIKTNSKKNGESNDAFVLLRDNLSIRIKIEATLSQLFNRTIFLEETGGFINPKVVNKNQQAYSFKENESHGLKEIITLLTLLHDDSNKYVIIDEPELHLHPQYQSFLIQEIRKYAGNPNEDPTKKCFFIVTHSPHILDIRTIDELKNLILFQPNIVPTYVDNLESDDKSRLNRLLSRLNTHHKQFLFSTKPVFVEGHTDQQIFSLIQEKRNRFVGSAGGSFIDVDGKDDLDLFFRLCKKLALDCQIIVDFDFLVDGKLREFVSEDDRCRKYLQDEGISYDLFGGIREIWQKLDACIDELKQKIPPTPNSDHELIQLHHSIVEANNPEKKRRLMILGIQRIKDKLQNILPEQSDDIHFIAGRIRQIIEACKAANVFVLPRGELENYFEGIDNHYDISSDSKSKSNLFSKERDYLLTNPTESEIKSRYNDLIDVLDSATQENKINYEDNLLRNVQNFIHKVQSASRFDKIDDMESLKISSKINYTMYDSILEILEYTKNDSSFTCKIKIKKFENIPEKLIKFDSDTNSIKQLL